MAHSSGISPKHNHYKKLKILKNELANSCMMILKVGSLNFFKMEKNRKLRSLISKNLQNDTLAKPRIYV